MSKISIIPEGMVIHMSECNKKTFSAIGLYPEEFHDWVDENPDVELECTIDYPLTNPCTFKVKGEFADEIIWQVINKYKKIYKEEDKTSKIQAGLVSGTYNRNKTDGKYGIWGHGFDDLILTDLEIDTDTNTLELSVES